MLWFDVVVMSGWLKLWLSFPSKRPTGGPVKHLVLLLALVPGIALADKSYNGEKSATHDCNKEPKAAVNTGDGDFTFTGTCDRIAINGGDNKITIESVRLLALNGSTNKVTVGAAEKIQVNGSDNTVNYKTGPDGKGKPKVTTLGTGNKVIQVK
jgi:hypothetical protein